MLEALANTVLKEVDRAADKVVSSVQRKLLRIALRAFFIIAGLAALSLGIILIGSKYVGVELMLVLSGLVFLLAFFLS